MWERSPGRDEQRAANISSWSRLESPSHDCRNQNSRSTCSSLAHSPGFTLLEIMVAIFIFAVIITTVFGSFRAVFSSTDSVGSDVTLFASARTALARMAVDLAAIQVSHYPRYQRPDFNDPPDPYRLLGDKSDAGSKSFGRLRFASLAHLTSSRDHREGVARIVYYVQRTKAGDYLLRRSDQLYPFPDFEESTDDPVLCEKIQELAFAFAGDEEETSQSWDSDSDENEYATPRAVDVKLTVGTRERTQTFTTRIPLYAYRKAKS